MADDSEVLRHATGVMIETIAAGGTTVQSMFKAPEHGLCWFIFLAELIRMCPEPFKWFVNPNWYLPDLCLFIESVFGKYGTTNAKTFYYYYNGPNSSLNHISWTRTHPTLKPDMMFVAEPTYAKHRAELYGVSFKAFTMTLTVLGNAFIEAMKMFKVGARAQLMPSELKAKRQATWDSNIDNITWWLADGLKTEQLLPKNATMTRKNMTEMVLVPLFNDYWDGAGIDVGGGQLMTFYMVLALQIASGNSFDAEKRVFVRSPIVSNNRQAYYTFPTPMTAAAIQYGTYPAWKSFMERCIADATYTSWEVIHRIAHAYALAGKSPRTLKTLVKGGQVAQGIFMHAAAFCVMVEVLPPVVGSTWAIEATVANHMLTEQEAVLLLLDIRLAIGEYTRLATVNSAPANAGNKKSEIQAGWLGANVPQFFI